MISKILSSLLLVTSVATIAQADVSPKGPRLAPAVTVEAPNAMDELDPFDPNIEAKLQEMDRAYEEETGLSAFLQEPFTWAAPKCSYSSCRIWLQIVKSRQTAYLYQNGRHVATWLVSTGISGRDTPNFQGHPNGRVYDRYTSTKYPEGDYRGLGNMPYAVFYKGGFAVHGTTPGSFKKLGKKASHGCVRLHPDNGYTFNRLVRQNGVKNVWISIQN